MEEVKSGMVSLHDGKSRPQPIKLHLTNDALILLKEELVPVTQEPDNEKPKTIREITIHREDNSGLGLSIKGGSDHRLPPLISKLVPDSPAAKTEHLCVGDAIIQINGQSCEGLTHSEVLLSLKNAGNTVVLTVKYFKPAAPFLNKQASDSSVESPGTSNDNNQPTEMFPGLERQWRIYISVQLLFAYLTRYSSGTDQLRTNAFEVIGVDGSSTGIMHCDDSHSLADWIRAITSNISFLISKMIKMSNRLLVPEEQIMMMNWMHERVSPSLHRPAWKPKFVALKGPDIYLFDYPPMQTRDWVRCDTVFKVYECMLQVCKDKELLDDRQHCCYILAGTGEKIYLGAESRADLLHLEKAWYRTNHSSITRLKHKTFGCSWRGKLSGLTLDLESGFSLYDYDTKNILWSYRFSQLRGSSDDGKSRLKLHFNTDPPGSFEIRDKELLDDRQHCCYILAGTGEKIYLGAESRADLLHLEKAWYRTNHSSITGLKNILWSYRFSQLRGSSDDGKSRLKLHFNTDPPGSFEIREIDCTGLRTLLYCMNAFLSAKLASVDPTFLSSC